VVAAVKTPADQRERRTRVARLHRAGVPVGEIAAAFGVKQMTMQRFIYQMRQEGWDIPHRPGGRRSAASRTQRPDSN
jgi:transposase